MTSKELLQPEKSELKDNSQLISQIRARSDFVKENRALYNLEVRQRRFNEGHNWDEDTETILVGSGDELALQRQTFKQEIWSTIVEGNVEEFQKILQSGQDLGKMRGVFGETLLHICFLFGQSHSPNHQTIARQLIGKYPELVNQIYDRQPYQGEAPIHMALTNNDEEMVRMLLENGANLHQRANGMFFRPSGKVYFGEFPLSFAACMNQANMVELLVKAGANISSQDRALGNTVLHLLVVYEQKEMYDYILSLEQELFREKDIDKDKKESFLQFKRGAFERIPKVDFQEAYQQGFISLDRIPNAGQRTPFTLAADLGKVDMFLHLINKKKELLWSYGKIRAVAYPLDELDTYPDPSRFGKKGALELIITHNEDQTTFDGTRNDRLRLLEVTPVSQLLQEKWGKFARRYFYIWAMIYICYLIIFNVAVLSPRNTSYRGGLEVVVVIGAFSMILLEIGDIIRLRTNYFREKGIRLFYFFIWVYCICILLAVIFRYTLVNSVPSESVVLSIASVMIWNYLLFFARGFKNLGYLIVIIREMIFGDIKRFIVIYAIFLFGYSVGFTILFQDTNSPSFKHLGWSMFSLYQYFMNDFPSIPEFQDANVVPMTFVLYFFYTASVAVLMLNLLIAMLNDTFYNIKKRARLQWKVEWASIILLIERRLPKFESKKHRSGKKGRDLGFDNDTHYIVLEERIQSPAETDGIIRPGQVKKKQRKLSVFIRDHIMNKNKIKKDKGKEGVLKLERSWAWPNVSRGEPIVDQQEEVELSETHTPAE